MIKILHVLSSLGGGGIESMLYNYYSFIDRSNVHFDFVVHGEKIGMLEKKFLEFGCKIYHVTPKRKSIFKNYLEIRKHMKNAKYDIVVVHQNYTSFVALYAGKKEGINIRVIHAHNYIKDDRINTKKWLMRKLNFRFATNYCACANEAGEWLYGKELWEKEGHIIYNAIDSNKFRFSKDVRDKTREKMGLSSEEICLLLVGRFSSCEQKNHKFAIKIMERLMNENKYKLFFAGDGGTEKEIKNIVEKSHLSDKVVFLGCVDNVNELMCAADVLLFPSKFEGFGIVAIEAQMCGLMVLASDVIPRATKISDNIEYLPISDAETWANKIRSINLRVLRQSVTNENYSIDSQAEHYEKYLKQLAEKI